MDISLHKTAHIENWLTILINTYRDHPSKGLAKVINYYIGRIIKEGEIKFHHLKLDQYCSMKKFWAWRSR
mgnify:CR=1 FL=1